MEAAFDDATGEVETEAEATYAQVLDEVGLELVGGQAVPSAKIKGKTEAKSDVSDLEKRLQDLKG